MNYLIKGFNPSTMIDWEGHVACIIYMPGCNFRCPFCHSSRLALAPDSIENIPFENIRIHLQQQKRWIDGVVIQGGEPTICAWLPDMLRELKAMGLKVKLDTNGYEPEVLKQLIEGKLVDYIALDIKTALDPERYRQAAGVEVDIERVRRSIAIVKDLMPDYEFRTTIVPDMIQREDIIAIAKLIAPCRRYVIQQFAPEDTLAGQWKGTEPYSAEVLAELAAAARQFVKEVRVRGA